jgi:regulator of sigma E protease
LFGGTARELPLSPAFAMGLKPGDKIVMANQTPIRYFHELATELEKNAGKTMTITYLRNGQQFTATTTPTKDGKLGFIRNPLLKTSHLSYGLGESIVVGTQKAFGVISDQLMAFGKIFRGEINPSKALGSFITIGKVYGPVWDWDHFWNMTGMLSMVLAFMNLLPIPALDGGHAVLLLYEMISGRKPSEKFQEVTQQIGMVLLLALMVFAIGNDIFRNFF